MNAAPTREHVEDDLNRVAHPLVGIKHNLARDAAQIAAREREAEFAPCRLVTTAFVEARPHDVELSLAHRALQAEQEAIVVERWIVDPVAVGNQGAGERTDLKELVPVATGAGEAAALEAEREADMADTNLGAQPLETGAALGGGGRKTEILVDDHDLGAWPAQSASSVGEAVLELSGLAVVLDLLEGGLPDVDDGEPIKMMGGHFVRRAHRSGRKVGAHARSPRPGWPGAALPDGRSPRSAVPADPKAGRTRTALAGGSSRPSRPALQPTSASRAVVLTTGPEKESTSSAEVPRPRDGSRGQAAGRGPVPLAQAPGRGDAADRSRTLRLARRARLETGARAAAGHGAGCAELSKKAWCSSAKRWQVLAKHDLSCV